MATDLIASQLISDLKRDFGLTNEQAAGVVGNLMYESGGFNSLQEKTPTVPGSKGGFGYAQWTGDRRKAFERYANDRGLDQNSYDANYGFMKHELETDPYERRQFNTVKKADTAAEAARLVSQNYLRPGTPNLSQRQNLATQALGYSKTPIPPGELPQVASQLDTRRTAPNPASVNPLMAASRAVTSPTGGNAALQSALDRVATAQRNRVMPASVDDRINARNMQFMAPQATASDAARIAALSMGGNQTFAGQERMPSRLAPIPASVDDRINARNLSQTQAVLPQSFAGQERATATLPVRLPEIAASPIGQAPATRTVQSVAVPTRSLPPQSFAGMERAAVTPVSKPLTNADLALNPIPSNPLAERLPSTPMAGARATAPAPVPGNFAVSTVLDTVNPAGRLMTAPGVGVSPLMAASRRVAPIPAVRSVQPVLRQQVVSRPQPVMRPLMAQAPLQISVSGANRISQPTIGVSTGRAYTPGQQYTMGGNVYTANSNGSFTNDRTGSEVRGSSSGSRSFVETPDGMQWR